MNEVLVNLTGTAGIEFPSSEIDTSVLPTTLRISLLVTGK